MGKAGQAVLGNTFSGMVDFYNTAKNSTNSAPVLWGLFLNGWSLGLPGGGNLSQGVLGTAQDTALNAAFSNLGTEASLQAATTVGWLKVGWDFSTFAYGYFVECQ